MHHPLPRHGPAAASVLLLHFPPPHIDAPNLQPHNAPDHAQDADTFPAKTSYYLGIKHEKPFVTM